MGRRSRSRLPPSERQRPPRSPAPAAGPEGGRGQAGLTPARRILAIYLVLAMIVAVLTVLGIAILGGSLGPLVTFAASATAAGLLFRWAQQRLVGLAFSDEDRVLQTMAGGLLVISVALATVSMIVLGLA